MIAAVIVAIVAAFIALIYFSVSASFKNTLARTQQMKGLGESLGLVMLDPLLPDSTMWKQKRMPLAVNLKALHADVPLIKMASSVIDCVLEGQNKGRLVRLFDLRYTVSTGKSSHTYYFGFAAVSIGKATPTLDIQGEGLWQKVKALFGKLDVQVDNPEFDKRFQINGNDEMFARAVLDYGLQEQLLRQPFAGHTIANGWALVYVVGLPTPTQYPELLARAQLLADRAGGRAI